MRYPKLQPVATSRKMVDQFRGYNHNIRIGDGEMYDMRNLTSDYFPVLSPRKRRGFYVKPASPQGLIAKEELCYVDGKSDWIDLRAAERIELKAGEFKLIPLGIAMQLPKGYEAHIVPRSSTFKNYGIIQTNHCGIVDESYCGNNDQWFMPAYALRDTVIEVNDRICQFRIMENQPKLLFTRVEHLESPDRGGFGSTGK